MTEVQIPAGRALLSRHTGLAHYLEKRSITEIYLMGLALDYYVKYGALDAGDIDRALEEMKRVGAILLKSAEL